jgi:cytidine deaminase
MDKELVKAAVAVRKKAYAPYSNFLVGAAARDEHGKIHIGCNVENASYPEGSCAETSAIASMVANGGRRLVEIVVVADSADAVTPCGGCRQKMREFGAPDLPVHCCDENGHLKKTMTLGELLPQSFGPEHLAKEKS